VFEVRLREVRQLFDALDPLPFREKDLDADAEEYIIESVRERPSGTASALVIHLDQPTGLPDEGRVVGDAVRTYFARRSKLLRRDLHQKEPRMKGVNRRDALKAIAGTAGLTALSHSAADTANAKQSKNEGGGQMEIKIPESLKAEHDQLHEELVRATKAGGKTGEAAKAVAKVLHTHFVKEEEFAMPPLGLLRALADGPVTPEMAKVIELSDELKKELPSMLKEHEAIVATLQTLAEAATKENQPQAQHFAERLKEHAKMEEDVTYPAAILVGDYVKLKLGK
jgi:hypothetical protein